MTWLYRSSVYDCQARAREMQVGMALATAASTKGAVRQVSMASLRIFSRVALRAALFSAAVTCSSCWLQLHTGRIGHICTSSKPGHDTCSQLEPASEEDSPYRSCQQSGRDHHSGEWGLWEALLSHFSDCTVAHNCIAARLVV